MLFAIFFELSEMQSQNIPEVCTIFPAWLCNEFTLCSLKFLLQLSFFCLFRHFSCTLSRNDRYVVDLDHTGIPDGNLYAVNLERGDRTGDNFIFLGRKGEDGDQTVKFTFPRDLVEVGDGWTVKARYITPDGTKSARIDCGAPF